MEIQNSIGSDIMMAFDECPPYPATYEYMKELWNELQDGQDVAQEAHEIQNQGLFGIVQGGEFEELSKQSAKDLVSLDFPGYAIGGLSVGEPKDIMNRMLEYYDTIVTFQQTTLFNGSRFTRLINRWSDSWY